MATPASPTPAAVRATASRWKRSAKFAVLVALLVGALGTLMELNRARIERNSQAWLGRNIDMALPRGSFDNDPLNDRILVSSADQLGTAQPVPVYRARRQGQPVAAVLLPVAPDGYGGPIQLLVAIDYAGTVLAVQVLSHRETPGLGDAFSAAGSGWLQAFVGRSAPASAAASSAWSVRKDGGDFDQFTGATITPRAIVKAVQRTLEYYVANRTSLYAPPET